MKQEESSTYLNTHIELCYKSMGFSLSEIANYTGHDTPIDTSLDVEDTIIEYI